METARILARARRRARDLPRGHAHPPRPARRARSAASAASRSRPACRSSRSPLHGTERARRGFVIRPCKVRVRRGRPLTFPRVEQPSAHLAQRGHRADLAVRRASVRVARRAARHAHAAVVGAGPMGTAIASLLARAGLEVELGCRTARAGRADRLERGERRPAARHRASREASSAKPVSTIEFQAVDLVVLRRPESRPARRRRRGRCEHRRAAPLSSCARRASCAPFGHASVGIRRRARARARRGGSRRARRTPLRQL